MATSGSSAHDMSAEEKHKESLREMLREFKSFHEKILKARGGKPLSDSVPDIREMREGR